jgi:nucleoside 2-deoxyribosyltransferase
MKVYLAGFINGNKIEQCSEWRKRIVTHYLLKAWDIIWLDPMNGKAITTLTPDGLHSEYPIRAIVDRDVKCLEDADLVVANLDTFGETRAPTGTLCEISITGYIHKPLIVITNDPNYYNHPWIQDFASITVPSVDELLEKKYIDYFYKGTVNARY